MAAYNILQHYNIDRNYQNLTYLCCYYEGQKLQSPWNNFSYLYSLLSVSFPTIFLLALLKNLYLIVEEWADPHSEFKFLHKNTKKKI